MKIISILYYTYEFFIIIECSYKWLYDARIVTDGYEFKESLY